MGRKWKQTIFLDLDYIDKFNPIQLNEELKKFFIKMYPIDALREMDGEVVEHNTN